MTLSPIIRNFDSAAPHYERAATAQSVIAKRLVAWAAESGIVPNSILDIGCGTGLVAEEAWRRWPAAPITALDGSPAMLNEMRRKLPQVSTLTGDVTTIEVETKFDALFCSMVLHWLPHPREALRRWQGWLTPGGKLFVVLPVEGSFQEWRDACRLEGMEDGLWPLPSADFADDLAAQTMREIITITYPSAHDFLRSMKLTGAGKARADHIPVNAANMRKALRNAPSPMSATYDLMFLMAGPCSTQSDSSSFPEPHHRPDQA